MWQTDRDLTDGQTGGPALAIQCGLTICVETMMITNISALGLNMAKTIYCRTIVEWSGFSAYGAKEDFLSTFILRSGQIICRSNCRKSATVNDVVRISHHKVYDSKALLRAEMCLWRRSCIITGTQRLGGKCLRSSADAVWDSQECAHSTEQSAMVKHVWVLGKSNRIGSGFRYPSRWWLFFGGYAIF